MVGPGSDMASGLGAVLEGDVAVALAVGGEAVGGCSEVTAWSVPHPAVSAIAPRPQNQVKGRARAKCVVAITIEREQSALRSSIEE